MNKLKIALDWTPNTNHTGLFVALELGFYRAKNIDLAIISPEADGYLVTPAKKLELAEVDFAIVPTESLISLLLKENKVDVKGIAAILREDTSSLITLASSNIARPKQLDGKVYASYKARYEDKIVKQVIINDGGTGDIRIEYPEKLGIWDTILTGEFDATWIFNAWEGIEAQTQGVALNYFNLNHYGVPYGYSPLVIAKTADIEIQKAVFTDFVSATRDGYLFAQQNPKKAIEILSNHVPDKDLKRIDMLKSQLYLNKYYGTEQTWGKMEAAVFQEFIQWLVENDIVEGEIRASDMFTNALIP